MDYFLDSINKAAIGSILFESFSWQNNPATSSGGQSEASWNTEAVEANVSRLQNISTPVSTVTPSGHFQVLLWNSVDKETVKRID